jgi:addiction module HigA family antidote
MMECTPAWRPSAPGEILRELYLTPHGVSVAAFARAAGVTTKHMSQIVNGHVTVKATMASRIAAVLGTTPQYWLNLQDAVDLYDARESLRNAKKQPHRMPVFAEAMAAAD